MAEGFQPRPGRQHLLLIPGTRQCAAPDQGVGRAPLSATLLRRLTLRGARAVSCFPPSQRSGIVTTHTRAWEGGPSAWPIRADVRVGSKAEKLASSKYLPVYPRKRTLIGS